MIAKVFKFESIGLLLKSIAIWAKSIVIDLPSYFYFQMLENKRQMQ